MSTRQIAREVFDFILKEPEKNVVLDFSKIEYASLSFFDELNGKKRLIQLLGKDVKFEWLNENIKKLSVLADETSKSKSSIIYTSVFNAEVITI